MSFDEYWRSVTSSPVQVLHTCSCGRKRTLHELFFCATETCTRFVCDRCTQVRFPLSLPLLSATTHLLKRFPSLRVCVVWCAGEHRHLLLPVVPELVLQLDGCQGQEPLRDLLRVPNVLPHAVRRRRRGCRQRVSRRGRRQRSGRRRRGRGRARVPLRTLRLEQRIHRNHCGQSARTDRYAHEQRCDCPHAIR
jgi:hypothetical protein